MVLFLLFLFSFLFIAGGLLQLSSFSKYATYVRTEGEVIAFIERIGGGQKSGGQGFKGALPVTYFPVVAYRVGETVYELEATCTQWKRPDFNKQLQLVYNPYQPNESYIKEGTPFLGLGLMAVSALGMVFLLIIEQ